MNVVSQRLMYVYLLVDVVVITSLNLENIIWTLENKNSDSQTFKVYMDTEKMLTNLSRSSGKPEESTCLVIIIFKSKKCNL